MTRRKRYKLIKRYRAFRDRIHAAISAKEVEQLITDLHDSTNLYYYFSDFDYKYVVHIRLNDNLISAWDEDKMIALKEASRLLYKSLIISLYNKQT